MKVGDIGEFKLIERISKIIGSAADNVLRSIGDDTAVVRGKADKLLLFTCDAQIDGVHFLSDRATPEQIGRRAAAVNLSDVAAMGGEASYALVSIAVPEETKVASLEGIYQGMRDEMSLAGAYIIGGNTAKLPERLLIDVFLVGEVSESELLTRDGAKVGDLLCVTGTLGASAAGLALIKYKNDEKYSEMEKRALERYFTPVPRLKAGRMLARSGVVTSCIDISDGLIQDAGHLAERSEVQVEIELENVPIAPEALATAVSLEMNAEKWALTGGEDFELLFTVKSSGSTSLIDSLSREIGLHTTVIGAISQGNGGVRLSRDGVTVTVDTLGFDHFS